MNWTNRTYVFFALVIVIFLNEFTLKFFDKSPPLSDSITYQIRVFDSIVILFGLTAKRLLIYYVVAFRRLSIFVSKYILPSLLTVLVLDAALSIFDFGYPSHYQQENFERYPNPSDSFRGKPNVLDHNEFGFRGNFAESGETFNVAIFGGSTTYNGSPPIIEIVRNNLVDQGINFIAFNFGSVSSNHSQHLHRLLEFSDLYKFDLVIFYGGGNETLQYASYDPRPGYPYNFFYRNELNPLMQALLRYSSIVGAFDIYTGGAISGLKTIRNETINSDWIDLIVNNYWRDLSQASNIARYIVQPNICAQTNFMSILQPGNPNTELQKNIWNSLRESQSLAQQEWVHVDLSDMGNQVEFTDSIHITQDSREIIADRISKHVEDVYSGSCR